jgi:hypothetical protein
MDESQEADRYFKIKMETHCLVDGLVMTVQSQFVYKLKSLLQTSHRLLLLGMSKWVVMVVMAC